MKQMSIFDLEEEQNKIIQASDFELLLSQLEMYGVDERYRIKHKGKEHLLQEIRRDLEEIPLYKEYQKKLYDMLLTYFKNNDEVDVIYYEEYDYIRINQPKCSYPLYCLEMIDKYIL